MGSWRLGDALCVRDSGVTSAAAVAQMMMHVWVFRIVLRRALSMLQHLSSIYFLAVQLLKGWLQPLVARAR